MAVEDASGHNPDQNESHEPVINPATQSFFDRFRDRFQSGETPWGKLLAGETEDDDDESEEDSDGTATEGVGRKKRGSFFEGLRSLILPRPEKLDDENVPYNLHGSQQEATVFSRFNSVDQSHESPSEDAEDVVLLHEDVSETVTEAPQTTEGGIGQSETPVDTAEPDQDTPEVIMPTVAPVESVEQILQRQQRAQERQQQQQQQAGAVAENSTPAAGYADRANVISQANSYERTRYPTAGLVALDVLNYGIAKHRDKKIDASSKERDERLKDAHSKSHNEITQRIKEQESVNKQLQERLELQEKQRKTALPRVRNSELRPRTVEVTNINVDKQTTKKPELQPQNVPEEVKMLEHNIVRAPEVALPSANTILHKVEDAAEKNIPIETLYELRHERKGNENFTVATSDPVRQAAKSLKDSNPATRDVSGVVGVHQGSQPSEAQDRKQAYQQAATTGALGAVVGIVLFIILYILTR